MANKILLALGGITGYYFIIFEKLWQIFYLYPQTAVSLTVKQHLAIKNLKGLKGLFDYLLQTDFSGTQRSIIESLLFHLAWIVVAVFTVTSTNVSFGQGLVMGLGFYLVVKAWENQRLSWQVFKQGTFWQVGRVVSDSEAKYYLYFLTGVFGLLTLLYI